ncbi:hypothetical protein ACEPAG_2931 [Sanghuangporus baumii]
MQVNYFIHHPECGFYERYVQPEYTISRIRNLVFIDRKEILRRLEIAEDDLIPYAPEDFRKVDVEEEMFQYVKDNYENWTKLGKAASLLSVIGEGELADRGLVHLVFIVQGRTTFQTDEAPHALLRAPHDRIHLREATVSVIWHKLMDYKFIWVRGTPGSGKSTLALLLDIHARKTIPEAKVIKLRGWNRKVNQS